MQAQERVARDPQDLFRFGEFIVQLFHHYTPFTERGARLLDVIAEGQAVTSGEYLEPVMP
jgi:hypothetical protein